MEKNGGGGGSRGQGLCSVFVDLYSFLPPPRDLVLFAQHLDKVEGDW